MSGRRLDAGLVAILLGALALRLLLAVTESYIHDEENTYIPLARSISFDPDALHLPLRAVNHPALAAYLAKVSSLLFGTGQVGYRAVHVLVGIATLVVIFLVARAWVGAAAARWATALLAFNEYFMAVSARVTAHTPYLFGVALAMLAFSRFLRTPRPSLLYATAAAAALAFYGKEHVVLLAPVLLLALLGRSTRGWLRGPHPYLAAALFAAAVAPDVLWNLGADPATDRVTYGNRDVPQATYGSHLQRIGGLGLSPYPVAFYARRTVQRVHLALTGDMFDDNTPEYHAMNSALGLLLLTGVAATLLRRGWDDPIRRFLLLHFGVVFVFFSLIRRGNSPGLDPASWVWVDATMLPAVILTGAWMSGLHGGCRWLVWPWAVATMLYACVWIVRV